MRSIGREAEFERVNRRINEFRDGLRRRLHFAVTAPPGGGLSLFLDDIAQARKTSGDVVFHAVLGDSRQIETPFADLAKTLSAAAGENLQTLDGELETLFDRLSRFRDACPHKIAVVIL